MSRKAIIYQSGDYVALEDDSGDYSVTIRFRPGNIANREHLADKALEFWGFERTEKWRRRKSWTEARIK